MSITFRLATSDDAALVGRLFHAIDLHNWGDAAPSPDAMADHVARRVLADDALCKVVLAQSDGVAVGLATYTIVYPAPDLSGQVLMKDLFVLAEARGRGVGTALIRYLARLAVGYGCSRLDWTAETTNPGALALYDRLGASRQPQKVYYRVDGAGLAALAAQD